MNQDATSVTMKCCVAGLIFLALELHLIAPGKVEAQDAPLGAQASMVQCRNLPDFGLYGAVRLMARVSPSDNLCPLADEWLGWHSTGLVRLQRGFPLSRDSLLSRVDFVFASHREFMDPAISVFADSVSAATAGAPDSLLFLRAVDEQSDVAGLRDTIAWSIRYTSRAPDPSRLWFSVAVAPSSVVESSSAGVRVRVSKESANHFRQATLRSQFEWLAEKRAAFGMNDSLPPLDVLLGPPGDTAMHFIGVHYTTQAKYAALWPTPLVLLLVSPLTTQGGAAPHEFAHLVHVTTPQRPFERIVVEGFALALGGSFGRSLDTEICELFRTEASSRASIELTPEARRNAKGGPWLEQLLFAVAVRQVLAQPVDSSRFFAADQWRSSSDAWIDLGRLATMPADSLRARARQHATKIADFAGKGSSPNCKNVAS